MTSQLFEYLGGIRPSAPACDIAAAVCNKLCNNQMCEEFCASTFYGNNSNVEKRCWIMDLVLAVRLAEREEAARNQCEATMKRMIYTPPSNEPVGNPDTL